MMTLISRLDELQTFKNELVQYSNSVISYLEDRLTEKEKKRGSEIYNTISKKVGYLGSFISKLSGIANVDVHGKEYDMWLIALKMPADKLADSALGVCLLATNKAIGKLTDDINRGVRDEQGNLIGKPNGIYREPPKALELLKECLDEVEYLRSLHHDNNEQYDWRDKFITILEAAFGRNSDEYKKLNTLPPVPIHKSDEENQKEYLRGLAHYEKIINQIIQKVENTDIPNYLFDAMQFHPKVLEASRELFKDGHYRDAIYRAFVEVNNFVKRRAKSQLDGRKLMSTVFNPANPIIKLNPLETQTDRDEQEGFMYLFMGAMQGIRNPKAHENIIQNNPYIALKLIGFASLLIQTIAFWGVEHT